MKELEVYLSVIVPAYNEGERIVKTLRRIHDYASEKPFGFEIVVVSDGSTDDTVDRINELGKELSHISVIDRKTNMGKGYSVKEGMLAAKGKIRLFTDADNSTDISHFDAMEPLFNDGKDIVICSRDPKDAAGATQAVSQAWYKRILGNLGNIYVQILAVWGIWDTQCGFKACTKDAAIRIFNKTKIFRWGFDIEMLAIARQLKMNIAVIPAHWINDLRSHVKMSAYIQVLWETTKVSWWLLRGAYCENEKSE